MKKFIISGMNCAACSAKVEKEVRSVYNVNECNVNLITGTMTVNNEANSDDIIAAVTKAGYGIETYEYKSNSVKGNELYLENDTTSKLKTRLIYSIFFLTILMYFSMGHTMFNFPLPRYLENNFVANCLLQMILAQIIILINKNFFTSGFKALFKFSPNMDSLVAIGASSAFIYSTFALFKMTDLLVQGDIVSSTHYMHQMYFESAAMIPTLITVGKMLESHAKGNTTNALKSLLELKPKSAIILKDGAEITVSVENITENDIFILKPGSLVPVDGEIIYGHGGFDEASLTGESIPAEKTIGDKVYAGTVNKTGYLKCRATRVGENTTLSQIINMVDNASSSKAPVAKIADKVSGVFVPIVISIAIITACTWLVLGKEIGFAIARGISVLVISCPCALGLATPVAIIVGNGVAAKNGVLFKTAASLENTSRLKTVVFDKTGTITEGKPVITDAIHEENILQDDLISIAYALESNSEHPLALAVVEYAKKHNVALLEVVNFEILPGGGLKAELNGKIAAGGNLKYITDYCVVPDHIIKKSYELSKHGKTVIYFCYDGKLLGIFASSDEIKDDSITAITMLKKMGIRTVLLTGDNNNSAEIVARKVGIDEVISEAMPTAKEKEIRNLMKNTSVAMVGDGINDAIALATADIGIAIGNGTDVAIDSADVVLMNSSLLGVVKAIKISKQTLCNIKQNLFWAFFYNAVGIPLAAGVLISTLGWEISPMFSAAAMSLSSFCVVTNALRLNNIRFNKTNAGKKENFKMEITLKIEGMMCPHCEANVKKNLELIDGVKEALPDYKKHICKIVMEKEVDRSILTNTVNALGYKAE